MDSFSRYYLFQRVKEKVKKKITRIIFLKIWSSWNYSFSFFLSFTFQICRPFLFISITPVPDLYKTVSGPSVTSLMLEPSWTTWTTWCKVNRVNIKEAKWDVANLEYRISVCMVFKVSEQKIYTVLQNFTQFCLFTM